MTIYITSRHSVVMLDELEIFIKINESHDFANVNRISDLTGSLRSVLMVISLGILKIFGLKNLLVLGSVLGLNFSYSIRRSI